MREILFRGKRVDNGEWIYGYVFTLFDRPVIKFGESDKELVGVIPETVGEFTGLTDKDGNKIFEGDILKFEHWAYDETFTGIVEYQICELGFVLDDGKDIELIAYAGDCYEVIGNKWDNPELLGETK